MRLNKTQSYVLVASCLVLLSLCFFIKNNPLDTEIINVEDGYGYEIYYKEKLLIKQKYIPAIATQKSFKTKQDAQKVALLVAQKIKKKQKPVVQITELDSLNIQRN